MHGLLWSLHKDHHHHHKNHNSKWERNDLFFLFYAVISMSLIMSHDPISFWIYFIVHDIFIHQRFKLFRKANHWYARGIRRAHKIHHKHLDKSKGECFGLLFVPLKYFKS